MRCQSGFGSAAPVVMLVITSAGAYSAAPIKAPTPAPTPSIPSPITAPEAAPTAVPQISASSTRPERLRLRRSGSPMTWGVSRRCPRSPHRDRRAARSGPGVLPDLGALPEFGLVAMNQRASTAPKTPRRQSVR